MTPALKVFRVHVVCTYPDGHPVKEQARARAGEYYKASEHNVTQWPVVLVYGDAEDAARAIRQHFERAGARIKAIYGINHVADVTVNAATPNSVGPAPVEPPLDVAGGHKEE